MMKRRRKLIIFGIITTLLLLIIIPSYIKVEILTWKYGNQFTDSYKLTCMIDDIEYFKVMEYSDSLARIYYVSGGKADGNLVTLTRQDEEWELEDWETVWSSSGSASDFIWPYYR